jgi:hypothetical protein
MTVSSKWLRRALLGGVALGVTATGAQADELSALKAQLEALQSRVNQLETTAPASTPALPQGASWITFNRGSQGTRLNEFARPQEYIPEDRGFTIAITPTADMPAPVHEVTVSGYVKGDLIFDTRNDLGPSFAASAIRQSGGDSEHVRLHARQSRFRIRSRSDTAVGQVRTLIEGDFTGGGGNELFSNSFHFRLRHAWGEWDMTPTTTIGIGQTWSNFMNLFAYPDTVDFFGPAGAAFARQGQIRITYNSGPVQFAVSVENPESDFTIGNAAIAAATGSAVGTGCRESAAPSACEANDNVPDFTARLQYEAPGGHLFQVSGILRNLRVDGDVSSGGITGSDSELAWGVLGAASINLADIATATISATYGDGIGRYIINGGFHGALLTGTAANPDIQLIEAFGLMGSLSFGLTDTTTANLGFGYYDADRSDLTVGMMDDIVTVHANLIWQPVSRFRMGVEAMWGETDVMLGGTEDALRFQFGAWFFF